MPALTDSAPDIRFSAEDRLSRLSSISAPRVFLLLACVLGVLVALITPPFQVPDEFMQFYRAYQVSEGRLTAYRENGQVGGSLPTSLSRFAERAWGNRPFDPGIKMNLSDLRAARAIPLNPRDREFYVFGNVSWHSPTNYLAQAGAIALARAAGCGPMLIFYAGRFGNLVVWSLLTYAALRIIPILDWTLLLLALTPMCLAQAASLSADATVNGICFLFVAVACRFALDERPITRARLLSLLVCGAAVSLAKTAYLPLTLLFLLIPPAKFQSARRYWRSFVLFLVVCFATTVAWSLCTFGAKSYSMPGVSPHDQAIYMLHHPLLMAHMEIGMLFAVPFIGSIIGQLGWHEIRLYFPATVVYFAVIFASTRVGGWTDRRMTLRQRVVLALACTGCWIAVFSLIYLTFTTVGGSSINGLQGRYMIPATAPFFLMFYPAPRARRWNPAPVIAAFVVAFDFYALVVLVLRFYK